MNKLLIIMAILVTSMAFSEIPAPIKEEKIKEDSCAYLAIGGLVPTLTFGGRANIVGNSFIDLSGSFSTLFTCHQFDLTLRGLTKYNNNMYIGGGLEEALSFNENISFAGLSAIATHGWDRPKNFSEVSLSFPLYKIPGHIYVPHFIVKYGWKF